jgi:hypothetical protein
MDNKLLYALAPNGATHHLHGLYRRIIGIKWHSYSNGSWGVIGGSMADGYEPIPARELELNRLADECTEWHIEPRLAKVDIDGFCFPSNLSPDCGFTKEQWQSRRALRIEHGLILEPAPEVDETPKSQWLPEVGEICEAYNFSLDIWLKAKTLDAKTESTPETAFVAINPDGACRMLFWSHKFRPIKTERERFIELTCCETDSDFENIFGKIHDWLIESGIDISPLMEGKNHE